MNRFALPLTGWPVLVLCSVYLLAGLIGHDPWKTEDAVHLGVAYEFASGGQWLSPRIGSDWWLGSPPLFHWCAALLGKALQDLMPFHDAARLATALFGGLLLLGLSRAAGALQDDESRQHMLWGAPLLGVGTLGLLVPIHDAEPAIAFLAAQAFVFFAIARMPQAPLLAGAVAGLALGAGFLAIGSSALLYLLPPFLTCLHPAWRSRRTLTGIACALLLGAVLCALWPLLLSDNAPGLLSAWWRADSARLSPRPLSWAALQDHLELLGWAAWPVLPLGLWSIWSHQRQLTSPHIFLPLLGSITALLQVLLFADPQPLQHLPLIVPFTLLATQGIGRLRRGAANAFDWFGMMTFTLIAGLMWLAGWSIATGEPARVAKNFYKAEPGFVGNFSWLAFAFAAVLTIAWIWMLFRLPRSPWRSATHWAAGITLMWGLIAALLVPWIDYGKSYRPVALALQKKLGDTAECVQSRGLGDAQKASLRYFTGLPLRSTDCPWLIAQSGPRAGSTPAGWHKVWEGNRPGDRSEKLLLFRRVSDD